MVGNNQLVVKDHSLGTGFFALRVCLRLEERAPWDEKEVSTV